jgi:hypothetical protein
LQCPSLDQCDARVLWVESERGGAGKYSEYDGVLSSPFCRELNTCASHYYPRLAQFSLQVGRSAHLPKRQSAKWEPAVAETGPSGNGTRTRTRTRTHAHCPRLQIASVLERALVGAKIEPETLLKNYDPNQARTRGMRRTACDAPCCGRSRAKRE